MSDEQVVQDAQALDQLIVDAVLEDRSFNETASSPRLRHSLAQREKAEILGALPGVDKLRNKRAYAGLPTERLVKLAWMADVAVVRAAASSERVS